MAARTAGAIALLGTMLLPMGAGAVGADDSALLSSFIARHNLKRDIIKPPKDGLLLHEYIVPDGPYFQLFDWDMYFMSAALSYDKVSRPVVGSIEDFLSFVDEFGLTGPAIRRARLRPTRSGRCRKCASPFWPRPPSARRSRPAGSPGCGSQRPRRPHPNPNYRESSSFSSGRTRASHVSPTIRNCKDTAGLLENNRRAPERPVRLVQRRRERHRQQPGRLRHAVIDDRRRRPAELYLPRASSRWRTSRDGWTNRRTRSCTPARPRS